jgi:hypothetical protein
MRKDFLFVLSRIWRSLLLLYDIELHIRRVALEIFIKQYQIVLFVLWMSLTIKSELVKDSRKIIL